MNCPTKEELIAFLDQELNAKQLAEIAAHIDQCERCQEVLEKITSESLANEISISPSTSKQSALGISNGGDSDHPILKEVFAELKSESQILPKQKSQTSSAHTAKELASQSRIGKYTVGEKLGSGGSGIVYRAKDESLNRDVALKVLHQPLRLSSNQDQNSLQRFEREAKSVAMLQHQNIVRLYEIGETETGQPYLAFEMIEGDSLEMELEREGHFSPEKAVETLRGIIAGVQAAHRVGLIHRDIKPSNVLRCRHSLQSKLLDFGLAIDHELDSRITMEGWIAGTPAYMSPEQIAPGKAETKQLDHRTDIYSVGVVFFEMLTGEVPFRGLGKATLERVINEDPPQLRALNSSIPRDLETICAKAISKKPSQRFQNLDEFDAELQRWCMGLPIQSKPISRIEKGWRWCQRNPVLAILSSVVAILILAVLTGSTYATYKLSQAHSKTLAAKKEAERESENAIAQSDALLETLQELVYKVNDTVENEYVDDDLLQRDILQIAMTGLRSVAENTDEGVIDLHTVDVHYRLALVNDRLGQFPQARMNFKRAKYLLKELQTDPNFSSSEQDEFKRYQLLVEWKLATLLSENLQDQKAAEVFESAQKATKTLLGEWPITEKSIKTLDLQSETESQLLFAIGQGLSEWGDLLDFLESENDSPSLNPALEKFELSDQISSLVRSTLPKDSFDTSLSRLSFKPANDANSESGNAIKFVLVCR